MVIPREINMDGFMRLVFVLCLIGVSATQTPPCTVGQFQPGNNDPKRPDLSQYSVYEAHMEANIVNKNYTIDYTEYFDYPNKRAATHITRSGARSRNLYSFNNNELFRIDLDDIAGVSCSVENLANSSQLFLFGRKSGNQAVMLSAGGSFRFSSNQSEQWLNRVTVRGVPCNLWRSCVQFPSGSTMLVDWYFSVPGWITTEFPEQQVPVRAYIKGVSSGRGQIPQHSYEHYYDFMDFETTLSDLTVFETPEGAYCPGRQQTKQLPTPVNQFHFTAEILDIDNQAIGGIKEYYDYSMNLVRFDLTPMGYSPYGPNPQTQIHDFTTGVAYIVDQLRGNCSVANISDVGFDVRNADPTHVRIRSSKEFFYFDKTQYNYEGTKVARNVLCDVWITQRNDWPPHALGNPRSTWEWYFATPDYTALLPDVPSFGLPVMLEINAGFNGHYIYNIYDYDERMPKVFDYDLDIGKCFNYTERNDFSFVLPGSFRFIASSNQDNFKYACLSAIVTAANGISRLRVNNIQVDYADNNDIIVTFTLLDKPPPIGDVLHPKTEPDLKTVASRLTDAINKGTFVVNFKPDGSLKTTSMKAKKNTFQATQRIIKRQYVTQTKPGKTSTSGVSGGIMAGMGVALLVVFFIIGVLGMYIFYRRQGGAFLPKKFDNTDITKDTS